MLSKNLQCNSDNILILDEQKSQKNVLYFNAKKFINIDTIKINNGSCFSIILEINEPIDHLKFILENQSILSLNVLLKNNANSVKITAEVLNNSSIDVNLLDFSDDNLLFRFDASLLSPSTSGSFKMASLASNDDKKKFDININHLYENTRGFVDNYGIAKDTSILEFSGTSFVHNSAKKSNTVQNAKIMLLDESSDGIAKPILKIDQNDVIASHSASIGQMNEEHLFYLTSRGLSINEAKRLIITGYFNPIIKKFENTNLMDEIDDLMKKKV